MRQGKSQSRSPPLACIHRYRIMCCFVQSPSSIFWGGGEAAFHLALPTLPSLSPLCASFSVLLQALELYRTLIRLSPVACPMLSSGWLTMSSAGGLPTTRTKHDMSSWSKGDTTFRQSSIVLRRSSNHLASPTFPCTTVRRPLRTRLSSIRE